MSIDVGVGAREQARSSPSNFLLTHELLAFADWLKEKFQEEIFPFDRRTDSSGKEGKV